MVFEVKYTPEMALKLVNGRGVTAGQVETSLGCGRTSATRLLQSLVDQGKVTRTIYGTVAVYSLVEDVE